MKNTTFESIGGTYKMANDCLIPELSIAESAPLGKWGLLRKHYLMDNHKALYVAMSLARKNSAWEVMRTATVSQIEAYFRGFVEDIKELTAEADAERIAKAVEIKEYWTSVLRDDEQRTEIEDRCVPASL